MKKRIFSVLPLITICFLILTVCCPYVFGEILLDRVVAEVNNEVITWSELRRDIETRGRDMLEGLTGEQRNNKIKELEKPFLKNMIDLKLQIQEAERLGFIVDPSSADSAIADIKRKYKLSDEGFAESLALEGLTFEEYRTNIKNQIILSEIVRFEVKEKILITDKEIDRYYEDNKEKYRVKKKFWIRQIFLAAPEDRSRRTDTEALAQELLERIKKGEDFAKLAGEFSEDATKKFGGDLGYVSPGSVLMEIEDMAMTLGVGEVSSFFWSRAGLHIVKLEGRMEGSDMEEVRSGIKGILFEKSYRSRYEEWLKSLREKAYMEIKL